MNINPVQSITASILKRPTLLTAIVTVMFITLAYQTLFRNHISQSQNEISQYIAQWKYEIADHLFHQKDPELAKKLIDHLKVFPITNYQVLKNENIVLSWQRGESIQTTCPHPTVNKITLRGLSLGKITTCLSTSKLTVQTLTSPLFIFITVLGVIFIVLASILPLLGYKKSLLTTLHFLRNWSQRPKEPPHIKSKDPITKDLVQLVKQGVQSRLELQEINDTLKTEKEFSKITHQVAHDIRSPVMSLNIAISQCKKVIPESISSLIQASIDRIVETSDDLLEQNKNNYRLQKINPERLTPIVLQILNEKSVTYNKVCFKTDLDDDLKVMCSATELKRVLSNIIENSLQAVDANQGEVHILSSQENNKGILCITDNGCGIAPEHLTSIFNEGFTFGKTSGSGLGLHYAKNRLESWGGSIDVESSPQRGSVLTLSFNIKNTVDQEAQL